MKTKKPLLSILILFSCYLSFAQDYKTEIEKDFTTYLNLMVNKEYKKSLDYVLPEIFTIVPKTQMVEVMEKTFNDSTIQIELKNNKIISIDNFKKIKNKYYSKIVYATQMDIKPIKDKESTEEEFKQQQNFIGVSFEKGFGKDNVKFNEETDFFEIKIQKNACAVSENGKNDWKFLVIEKNQKALLEKLIPKELIKKL